MSKAITGAIEIAAGAALIATGVGAGFGASLVMMGAGQELSALADMLQSNAGIANTVRQSAAPRRIIYGTQRVGGVEVYESTTGGSKDQYNLVFVFAAHEITNFVNLYLDGRQVYWAGSAGYTTRNGIGFGGGGDGNNHTAPDGSTYNFANAISGHEGVYVEARFGDQASGDYMSSLTANDGRWAPDGLGNAPSLMECAYLYVKAEYDTNVFPNKPNPRATIKGKACYDPRTGLTAYTENWALIVADVIQNTEYGLGGTVNADQLIAAANICDEAVPVYGGGSNGTVSEPRFSCNYTWTTDKSIGNVLSDLMLGAAGRLSIIEGEWYIFPGSYVAPVVSYDSSQLLSRPRWSAQRKYRAKINSVRGTYIASNFPYSIAGNLYDSNGWFNGTLQDNWPFCFEPTDYPAYACDTLHGYPSDQYLTEDSNVELDQTLDLPCVLSIAQAQRLAKIELLRNRQQGSGTFVFGPEGLLLQPNDTFLMTFAQRGWSDKLLEVLKTEIAIVAGEDGIPQLQITVTANETDPTVYAWNGATEELTPYDVPAFVGNPGVYTTAAPTSLTVISSAATALLQPDGSVTPQLELTWNTPNDSRVSTIEMQYQIVGASSWSAAGSVSVASNVAFIPAVAGKSYNVRIRSVRASGGVSVWVEVNNVTAGLVLSIGTQDGVGIGTLRSVSLSGATAAIFCNPFEVQYGYAFEAMFPSGSVTISVDGTIGGSGGALQQHTLYWVYYVDPTFAGGDLTPIATTNKSDFLGKYGYFLIDSIVTATGATMYSPSTFTDSGDSATGYPQSAYDGDPTTWASVGGTAVSIYIAGFGGEPPETDTTSTSGDCTWSGFESTTTTTALNLYIITEPSTTHSMYGSSNGAWSCTVTIAGVATSVTLSGGSTTVAIPIGTNLSTVTVEITATPGGAAATSSHTTSSSSVTVKVYEIYIAA